MHIFARSLATVNLLHQGPQRRIHEIEPLLPGDGNLCKVPIKLGSVSELLPPRLTGFRRRSREYVRVSNRNGSKRAFQFSPRVDKQRYNKERQSYDKNPPPASAHPGNDSASPPSSFRKSTVYM